MQVQMPMTILDTLFICLLFIQLKLYPQINTKTYKKLKNNQQNLILFTNQLIKQGNQQQSGKDKINKFPKMIELNKIDLLITQKLFNESTKKYIRIQAQPTKVIRTMNFAKPVSQTNLQWSDVIELQYITDKQMPFQIYEKHEFGYRPQELSSVMHGKMKFDDRYAKFFNWQVFDSSERKMGYLSVSVKSKPRVDIANSQVKIDQVSIMNSKKLTDNETELVVISSIVVNIPQIKAKRAYALLTVGNQNIRTSPVKSKSGELVFIEKYELEKAPKIQYASIDIFSCGQDEPDVKIATSKVRLQKRIDRKLRFYLPEDQKKQVGQGFIDGKVQLKSQIMTDRIFAGIIKKGIQNQFSNTNHNNTAFKPLSRSIVLANKSSTLTSDDRQYSPITRARRFSIVNKNSNIKIPQQKRFFTSRDPANKYCSYLPQQSFQFKLKKVDKYYRGASIGYGDKVDFTHPKKSIPSVGKYQLPSIWDRY